MRAQPLTESILDPVIIYYFRISNTRNRIIKSFVRILIDFYATCINICAPKLSRVISSLDYGIESDQY